MNFADGWICRSCWKPNKRHDERCYRCKSPRKPAAAPTAPPPAPAALAEAAPAEVVPGAEDRELPRRRPANEPRGEPVPDILVAIPVVVFSSLGWLWRKLAIVIVVFALLLAVVNPFIVLAGAMIAVFYYAFGLLYGAIASGMRDRASWAFLAGLVFAGIATAIHVIDVFIVQMPALPPGMPGWLVTLVGVATILEWASLTINGAAAACAFLGLILAVVRPPGRSRVMTAVRG